MSDIATTATPAFGIANKMRLYAMEVILLVLVLAMVISAPGFATWGNVLNVLRTVSMLGIVAYGMTAVIIAGEIDLSVGSGVALAGCITAWFCGALTDSLGEVGAVMIGAAAALAIAFAYGFIVGKIREWFNVPTFIITLGLFTALRGIANLITGGFPMATFPDWFEFLGAGYLLGIPVPVYVFLAIFGLMHFILTYTRFGRAIYAVGGNAEAARLSGINVALTRTMTMAIVATLAALSGILYASQIGSANGTTATGMEMEAIAATIIGGASFTGGKGRVWGTLLGVLFLGCIANGMTLMNVSEYWQQVVRGAIILAAVLMNMVLERNY